MFFFFTVGTQDFSGRLKGYEDMVLQCRRCTRNSVVPIKRRNFFTFCFIPIFPIKWTEELRCGECNYHQKTTKAELDEIRARGPQPLPQPQQQFGFQQPPPQAYSPYAQEQQMHYK
ncbi:hypothetical protein EX30DRAFT_368872 [Ascodesmis nigricans]|uniref:Zinc-ribbon 15 domain-containing protein n=1 Tax=Ascodesmis nigricans TaxID=341454 RepID=A0A4S2N306_9PEZI|nr:hypothetical protein EX30DRAFT_368872 [Ascodesmis nigricans]